MNVKQWEGFKPGKWMNEIDVRDFIHQPYEILAYWVEGYLK